MKYLILLSLVFSGSAFAGSIAVVCVSKEIQKDCVLTTTPDQLLDAVNGRPNGKLSLSDTSNCGWQNVDLKLSLDDVRKSDRGFSANMNVELTMKKHAFLGLGKLRDKRVNSMQLPINNFKNTGFSMEQTVSLSVVRPTKAISCAVGFSAP